MPSGARCIRAPDGMRVSVRQMRAKLLVLSFAAAAVLSGCFPSAFGGARQPTPVVAGEPQVSPDGTQVAYIHNIDGDFDIYVMPVAGGTPRNLTNNDRVDADPSWLPDGSGILFTSAGEDGDWELFRMDADGSNRRQISRFRDTDSDSQSQ